MEPSPSKKRKADDDLPPPTLSVAVAEELISSYSRDQLLSFLRFALPLSSSALSAISAFIDSDRTFRRLLVVNLHQDTTDEDVRSYFSRFGHVEEASVAPGGEGSGIVTFRHAAAAIAAIRASDKMIRDRLVLAAFLDPLFLPSRARADELRAVLVSNVPPAIPPAKLRDQFSSFGDVEVVRLGFDMMSPGHMGRALLVYESAAAARSAVEPQLKMIEGHQVECKLADPGTADAFLTGGGVVGGAGGPSVSAQSSIVSMPSSTSSGSIGMTSSAQHGGQGLLLSQRFSIGMLNSAQSAWQASLHHPAGGQGIYGGMSMPGFIRMPPAYHGGEGNFGSLPMADSIARYLFHYNNPGMPGLQGPHSATGSQAPSPRFPFVGQAPPPIVGQVPLQSQGQAPPPFGGQPSIQLEAQAPNQFGGQAVYGAPSESERQDVQAWLDSGGRRHHGGGMPWGPPPSC